MTAGSHIRREGDGNGLEKSSGKIYWYGAGTEILDESDTSGNFTNEYVFFGGKRIAIRSVSSGTIDYYEEDMLGSSRTLVQAGGTSPCFDADFLPFGYEKDVTTTCSQNYKFEGKERDTETGDDDFGARYYTFRLGRWLSADWSSVPAPVPYANLTNPQTLNLYAMVSDNPESFADLTGHDSITGGCFIGPGGSISCKSNPSDPVNVPDKPGEGANTGTGTGQSTTQQAQQPANNNAQPQPQSSSPSSAAAVGALPLIGRALAGAELGGESGAEVGTPIEPGLGTAVGATAGALVLGTVAALSPNAYTKTKDAISDATQHLETAIDHLEKAATGPPDPQRGWKNTVLKSADNMDKAAGKMANKSLKTVTHFTADVLRAIANYP